MRGNLCCIPQNLPFLRSIPACAGEPARHGAGGFDAAVYPRVCGGTICLCRWASFLKGLSPRVRGNLGWLSSSRVMPGSIPACAGEPQCRVGGCRPSEVYPRVCGGTRLADCHPAFVRGLSPRVRGNRAGSLAAIRHGGSIPACAGEPPLDHSPAGMREVYPRVCGGTCAVGTIDACL